MTADLGETLSAARRTKGLSLRDVEAATGISNAYVSQLESGTVGEPSPKKLAALARVYGVPYSSLMEAAGYAFPDDWRSAAPTPPSANRIFVVYYSEGGGLGEVAEFDDETKAAAFAGDVAADCSEFERGRLVGVFRGERRFVVPEYRLAEAPKP